MNFIYSNSLRVGKRGDKGNLAGKFSAGWHPCIPILGCDVTAVNYSPISATLVNA